MDVYKERIRPLFDKSGLQDKQIEELLELPRGVIYKWGTGKYKSYKTYLHQIASYFHVSIDYLLGNTDDPRPAGQKESPPPCGGHPDPVERELMEFVETASDDERRAILEVAHILKKQRRG